MKRVKHTLLYLLAVGAMLLTGCSDDFFGDKTEQHDSNRIQLSGDIDQLAVTRVNDNGFCNGDVMGVYIVDYEGNKPGTLKVNGNREWRNGWLRSERFSLGQGVGCDSYHQRNPFAYGASHV